MVDKRLERDRPFTRFERVQPEALGQLVDRVFDPRRLDELGGEAVAAFLGVDPAGQAPVARQGATVAVLAAEHARRVLVGPQGFDQRLVDPASGLAG